MAFRTREHGDLSDQVFMATAGAAEIEWTLRLLWLAGQCKKFIAMREVKAYTMFEMAK